MERDLIVYENWYVSLIDDCKAIITEAVFTSRWALVEGYHHLGERIIRDKDYQEHAKGNWTSLQGLARNLGISDRTIYYAMQFYEKYPDLSVVPEGKNITWNKLITKYLPAPEENIIEIPLPEGKFDVIIIDPPWPYGTEYNKETRRVASPYRELPIEELETLVLPAADNCVLWLWTTHRFIGDAEKLMDIWGFEYKLVLVWDKEKLGLGEWLRCQSEFCLLGIKGKPEWKLTNERDIIREARREHSRKPEVFYSMVKKLCPGKRINMFSREEIDGFDGWGTEAQ